MKTLICIRTLPHDCVPPVLLGNDMTYRSGTGWRVYSEPQAAHPVLTGVEILIHAYPFLSAPDCDQAYLDALPSKALIRGIDVTGRVRRTGTSACHGGMDVSGEWFE